MKKFLLLIAGGLLAASLAAPVLAAGSYKGKHEMYGDVTNIDHEKGNLTVTNNEVTMTLNFPPASIKKLKSGDKIKVKVQFERGTGVK